MRSEKTRQAALIWAALESSAAKPRICVVNDPTPTPLKQDACFTQSPWFEYWALHRASTLLADEQSADL